MREKEKKRKGVKPLKMSLYIRILSSRETRRIMNVQVQACAGAEGKKDEMCFEQAYMHVRQFVSKKNGLHKNVLSLSLQLYIYIYIYIVCFFHTHISSLKC